MNCTSKVKYKVIFIFCFLFQEHQAYSLKIDRVILSSDTNPMYLDFWPLVGKAWKELIGIKPTLVLVAEKDVIVDETIGDVIRFEPIKGISTAFQSQVIRLLIPIFFDNEVSIISDIDMLPLNRSYFINSILSIPEDRFVVYKDKAYAAGYKQLPMCYVAAKGSIFKEIFNVYNLEDVRRTIVDWHKLGYGWNTDERMLYSCLLNWKFYHQRCVRLGHNVEGRIDRSKWEYDIKALKSGNYIDAHLLRPYSKFKTQIDRLCRIINLDVRRV